ncbi:hypothetical protein [Pseudobacteriovorax antillogorgiicola]|uniref:Uncharacterized protein n=1 Tax=Pseudobacteriovorax antillogorgiicola TaxID=1513793 RepID=A0A1Y6CRC4_9BACT|nr:hypothetical protein [Pseudobacteriovorax antillogorgiicola]TCS45698.1 hypothetical protein EDD56_12792 [Pseudobacteriovorax antillogorgiicola]SMF73365.1 hypothetical protein SAMN06296036_12791 [Pseudobacteriovorax antillogorgiicola]
MDDKKILQKAIKRAILKIKNGSASSEEISAEFATAIEKYFEHKVSNEKQAS